MLSTLPMKKNHHHRPIAPQPRDIVHESIANLAHELWERAGQPDNSAEADWLAAELELKQKQASMSRN